MDDKVSKVSFFHVIHNFFSKFKPKKKKGEFYFESYSKFRQFIDESDGEILPFVQHTVELCDEGIKNAKHRIILARKIQDLDDNLIGLECFNKLSEEETAKIRNLLDRFTALSQERRSLIEQLTEFDPTLSGIIGAEEQAAFAIGHIQDAEKSQRILRTDLGYLKGEKADLEYEHETLENSLDLVNKFITIMVSVFSVAALALGFFNIFYKFDIFFPVSILVILLILITATIIWFRRKTEAELKLNLRKQNRAVELLNKKNVVYAYYTNFLNYEYRKYKVKNSQMLKTNMASFSNYKHITSRIDSVRLVMFETENEIEKFLVEKNIADLKISVENFSKNISIDDKRQAYNNLLQEKKLLEADLSKFDTRHEQIWDELVYLNDKVRGHNRMIEKIIQVYLDEVSNLFVTMDNGKNEKGYEEEE